MTQFNACRKLFPLAKSGDAQKAAEDVLIKGVTDVSKYDWRTLKYNLNIYLTRSEALKVKKDSKADLLEVTPIRNFNATFSFVHFLAVTGKFRYRNFNHLSIKKCPF